MMIKKALVACACFMCFLSMSLNAQDLKNPVNLAHDNHENSSGLKAGVLGSFPQHMEEAFWADAWMPYATEDTEYSIEGLPTQIERNDSSGKTRQLFSYNDQGWLTQTITQTWIDMQWQNQTRTIDSMNEDGDYLGYTFDTWIDGVWVLQDGMAYTVQKEGGLTVEMIISVKRPGLEWVNMQRYVYTYPEGSDKASTFIMEVWNSGQWVLNLKVEYTYGDGSIEQLGYNYINGSWTQTSKMIETTGEYNSYYLTTYSNANNEWVPSGRSSYEYDIHGNQILYLLEFYTGGWEPYMGNRYLLIYDGTNLIQRISQMFTSSEAAYQNVNQTDDWKNTLKEVFSNFHSAGVLITSEESLNINSFPNPANEMLFIKANNPGGEKKVNVSILNMTGQRSFTESYSIRTGTQQINIPVNQLPAGVYILHIQDTNGRYLYNEMVQIH